MEYLGQFIADAKRILTIGYIDERRLACGISQLRLAQRAGCHLTSYCDWRRGRYQPRADMMLALLEALELLSKEDRCVPMAKSMDGRRAGSRRTSPSTVTNKDTHASIVGPVTVSAGRSS